MQNKNKFLALGGWAIFFVAAFIRIYAVGQESLWHDEAFTWFFTRLSWFKMLDTVRLDGVNPPIYYIGVKLIVDILGDGEFALRLLSILAGIGSIYVAGKIGKLISGDFGGMISMAWIGFHPMAVHYSRDARPYSLALLFSLLLVYYFVRLGQEKQRNLWLGAITWLLLGQMTHYFFFVLGGIILLLVMTEIRAKPLYVRHWMLLWMGGFLPLVGWLGWYFAQPTPSLGIGWIQPPRLSDIIGTWWNLLSGYGGDYSTATSVFGLVTLAFVIGSICGQENRSRNSKWLGLGLVTPVVAIFLVSLRRPVFVDRYFIVFLPLLLLLVADGSRTLIVLLHDRFELNIKNSEHIAMVIMITIGIWSGWHVLTDEKYIREDWRGLVTYLQENVEQGEQIWLSEPEASIPIQYYFRGDLSSAISSLEPLECQDPCWWVLRQPYTATHAFSQSIKLDGRQSYPSISENCRLLDQWQSNTGVALWYVNCKDALK